MTNPLVCVKRVVDATSEVVLTEDGTILADLVGAGAQFVAAHGGRGGLGLVLRLGLGLGRGGAGAVRGHHSLQVVTRGRADEGAGLGREQRRCQADGAGAHDQRVRARRHRREAHLLRRRLHRRCRRRHRWIGRVCSR